MLSFKHIIILFFLLELLLYFFLQQSNLLLPALLSVLFAYLLLFALSMNLNANIFLTAKSKAKSGCVVLGFDDGPDPEMTPKILDILDAQGAQAIFFLIGKNAEKHPEIVKDIIQRGHLIGGHSLHHYSYFGTLGAAQTETEIMEGIAVIEAISQQKVQLFRPPLGVMNPIIARVIKNNHLQLVGWNIRPYDTIQQNPQKMLKRIQGKLQSGSSILLHDRMQSTVSILPDILQTAKHKQLRVLAEID